MHWESSTPSTSRTQSQGQGSRSGGSDGQQGSLGGGAGRRRHRSGEELAPGVPSVPAQRGAGQLRPPPAGHAPFPRQKLVTGTCSGTHHPTASRLQPSHRQLQVPGRPPGLSPPSLAWSPRCQLESVHLPRALLTLHCPWLQGHCLRPAGVDSQAIKSWVLNK